MGVDPVEVRDRIAEFADYSMWKRGTPGLVVGVTDRDKTLFTSAKGLSCVAGRQPMLADALFQIGSTSKSFTCMVALQLAEEGVLDIHAPVKRYLPWFSVKSRYSDITLHHLMTHTAGIIVGSDATPTSWTETWDLRDTEATCEPGTYYHYSNSGYKALGLALETVTGIGYDRMIRERILEPAGMRSTEPVITNGIRERLAVAHQPLNDDRPFRRGDPLCPAPWFEGDFADGSICAPVEDMLAYIRVVLNKGEAPWGRLMSSDSFRRMTTPYIETDDNAYPGDYGYGLVIESVDGHRYIGHQGRMVGYYSSMLTDMDAGIGIMAMINGPGDPEETVRFAMDAFRKAGAGDALPDVPSRKDIYLIPDASDYTGTFAGPHGRLDIETREGELRVITDGHESPLEPMGRDLFLADDPAFDLFFMEFKRRDASVDRVHHGGHTYVKNGSGRSSDPPAGSTTVRYDGHYRSHNPWVSNFRVVRRPEGLVLIPPDRESVPLVHLGDNVFRIGADERSPEKIAFGGIINGVATSATVSGEGRFGRAFTP